MSASGPEAPDAAPAAEYARRLETRRARAARLAARARLLSRVRLAVFVAGVGVAWAVFGARALAGPWLLPPVVAFVALVLAHDRVIQRRRRADRAVAFYDDGIARLEDRWAGRGATGDEIASSHPDHPYARDLDLFGRGSLFELLSRARTPGGERTLARWLLAAAPPEVVCERQAAVQELTPRLDLREDLALVGEEIRTQLAPDALARWGEAPVPLRPGPARIASAGLVAITLATAAAWWWAGVPFAALALPLAVQGAWAWRLRSVTAPVIRSVDRATHDLGVFAQVVERLERERFDSPLLARLRERLSTDGVPASRRIAGLQRIAGLLDARRNQLFAPVGALLLWGTQLALAIEAWRAASGPSLRSWLEAVGEFEALSSLAGFAWENPSYVYPTLLAGDPVLEGRRLGHPLLPRDRCVANDLRLAASDRLGPQALVVSGSNMSGKSTFLRTVGTNAVLAQAGAPVRATRLDLTPLDVGASILVSDSLQEGTSRFYAEIKRLRQVMDLARNGSPALFLLDEVLQGTNSHDRRIGVEALLRGLVEHGAVGLVTTHDLALAEIADEQAPRLRNVHFEDHLEDGEIAFDYRLREGVVRKSNALALMRAVGLEV